MIGPFVHPFLQRIVVAIEEHVADLDAALPQPFAIDLLQGRAGQGHLFALAGPLRDELFQDVVPWPPVVIV